MFVLCRIFCMLEAFMSSQGDRVNRNAQRLVKCPLYDAHEDTEAKCR